jgi:hypothetical protein
MRKPLLALLCLAALAGNAEAMHLNSSGLGQVLIAPYYSVNAGNQTLISIANRNDQGKALKVRFLEGMNGREVFGFNLYLAPHDLWTGALFSQTDSGPATLITLDDSCTVPALKTSTSLPQLPSGPRIAPFNANDYSGARDDAGPDGLLRTRDGYFEVIEMGTVINAAQRSLNDISPGADGLPANCPRIVSAWEQSGYWAQSPEIDLAAPGGGLTASVSLVDVFDGTLYSYQAEAIDGFSGIVQHTAPGDARPNLSSGNTPLGQGLVEASVEIGDGVVRAQYPVNRAIDAVSALLIAETISNEFVTSASVGAASTWVVTLPTKKFYTDNAIVQNSAIAPFTKTFSASYSQAWSTDTIYPPPLPRVAPVQEAVGEALEVAVRDREGKRFHCGSDLGCAPYPQPVLFSGTPSIHWATSVFAFNAPNCVSLFSGTESRLCQSVDAYYAGVRDGWMSLRFTSDYGVGNSPLLRADINGHRFAGLPAIGFWAMSSTNGQLQPGVLSNYASLRRHIISQRDVPVFP